MHSIRANTEKPIAESLALLLKSTIFGIKCKFYVRRNSFIATITYLIYTSYVLRFDFDNFKYLVTICFSYVEIFLDETIWYMPRTGNELIKDNI
ncbi:hypothetical protein BpHYR1_001585 [Brachionus plicatilis]|uniref:Uncharacterized protein n=1 Tax=Brachionus plicatilis TaxID=10195 RepID=A0A3M7QIL7_BRAPC|nr:hypothetical protein BpHYR1_001585 [Brachionus plicatilis]